MKQVLFVLFILIICLMVSFSQAATFNGDLDGDYKISILDVRILLQYFINQGDNNESDYDLNDDGLLDILDVRLLLQMYINGVNIPNQERIHFINLNRAEDKNGDAILLEVNGKYALVDSGHSESKVTVYNYLTKYNVTELEFVILTHGHIDHIGGLNYLIKNGIRVKQVYMKDYSFSLTDKYVQAREQAGVSNKVINESAYNTLMETFADEQYGIEVIYLPRNGSMEGTEIEFGTASVYLFNTYNRCGTSDNIEDYTSAHWFNNGNVDSIATLIVAENGQSALLTGDINSDMILKGVINRAKSITSKFNVYQMPHHGQNSEAAESNWTSGCINVSLAANGYIAVTTTRATLIEKGHTLNYGSSGYTTTNGTHINLNDSNIYYSAECYASDATTPTGIIFNLSKDKVSHSKPTIVQ